MKIILLAVAALVVVVVLVPVIVGFMLPVAHVASREQHFDQSPEQLWPYVVAEFHRSNDGNYRIASQRPPSELVTEVAHPKFFGGTWTYTLTPENGGTHLTIVEHGEVYNPVFRFLSKFVFGQQGSLAGFFSSLDKAVTNRT